MLEIREPNAGDRAGIAQVDGLAFNYAARPDNVSVLGALCAFDGGRVVGTSQAIALDQWFGGSRVPCAGVASVAVLPEYRGRGVAGALMRQLLEHRRAQGDAVSTLYPANSQLYRRLGYEFGGLRPGFRAPVADLPAAKAGVREMAPGDRADLMACYSRYVSAHNGPVETADPARWSDHVLAHEGEGAHQRTVVVPADGGVDGYASYFLESWGKGGYAVHCKHLVAVTAPALRALLGHLRRFENSAQEIVWHGPASTAPVGFAITTSGFAVTPALRRWMFRALDVRCALEARGYPHLAGGEVVLAVEDPMFPANNGPWLVQVEGGRARLTPAPGRQGTGRPIPIGPFSALYTGMVTPADLVLMGVLDGDDPRLPVLSALFAGPVPWMPDLF